VPTAFSAAFSASAAESVEAGFFTTGFCRPGFGVTAIKDFSVAAVHNTHSAGQAQVHFVQCSKI
jgi:hypothetical protein